MHLDVTCQFFSKYVSLRMRIDRKVDRIVAVATVRDFTRKEAKEHMLLSTRARCVEGKTTLREGEGGGRRNARAGDRGNRGGTLACG